jgi:hypothetical protein
MALTQPKLGQPYKQDLESFFCCARTGNKHTLRLLGCLCVVLVCFPETRALLSSENEMEEPSLERLCCFLLWRRAKTAGQLYPGVTLRVGAGRP